MTRYLIDRFKNLNFKDLLANFRSNWFISASAVFYLLLNTGLPVPKYWIVNSYFSFVPAVILIFLLSLICPSFIAFQSHTSNKLKVFALINSVCICFVTWADLMHVTIFLQEDPAIQRLVFMFLAIPFVYVVNVLFWNKLGPVLKEAIEKTAFKKGELAIYAFIYLLFCFFIAYCFLNSQAFYGTKFPVDIIYTSDSPKLLKTNVFIIIDHIENDLRQPLFAVFSVPFMGIPSFLGKIIPGVPQALFIAFFQLILLMFSAFLLARTINLNKIGRICFIVFSSFTYTQILFSIMIDQYVIAYFWLILTIYLMNEDDKNAFYSSFAASGTLLTSGILVPFILKPKDTSRKSYGKYIENILFYGFDFLLLMLLSDRFHILWNSVKNLKLLFKFSGEKIGFTARILQYFNFVSSCFFAPATEIKQLTADCNSWQLADVTSVNYAGVIILALVIISFLVTGKSRISRIAFCWICFSMIVLVFAGWGTNENGLILYSLYFGWPFLVLLFNFLNTIEDRLKNNIPIPLITTVTGIIMLAVNIPGIISLIEFAINEYPA